MSSLNFDFLKQQLESKGFKQGKDSYNNCFIREQRHPWWKFWGEGFEVVIVGHFVWFYDNPTYKTWGSCQDTLEALLKKL